MADRPDLAALIGSRICHDLVSPLGAVGNGIELLTVGGAEGPETELIAESLAAAQGRIAVFRVAFGPARDEQVIEARARTDIAEGVQGSGRLTLDWAPEGPLARPAAKLAALLMLCAESALPRGGHLAVTHSRDGLQLAAEGRRVSLDEALWPLLDGAAPTPELRAAHVQFPLAAQELARQGRRAAVDATETTLTITC